MIIISEIGLVLVKPVRLTYPTFQQRCAALGDAPPIEEKPFHPDDHDSVHANPNSRASAQQDMQISRDMQIQTLEITSRMAVVGESV